MSVSIQLVSSSGLDHETDLSHSASGTATQSAPSSPVSASRSSKALCAGFVIAELLPSKPEPCSRRFQANSPNPTPRRGCPANIATAPLDKDNRSRRPHSAEADGE